MADEPKKNVGFKLLNITTEAFAAFPDLFNEKKKIEFQQEYSFGVDSEKRAIGVYADYRFTHSKTVFLNIKVGCHFEIHQDNWMAMDNPEKKQLVVQPGFLGHLTMLTIGTARGILHAKTENSPLNRFMLPTINVTEIISKPAELLY